MNTDTIKGKWHQVKGQIKKQWAKLTDDDIDYLSGHYEDLAGKIQERYGITRDEAKKAIHDFEERI